MQIEGNHPYLSLVDVTDGYRGYLWYTGNSIQVGSAYFSGLPVTIAPNVSISTTFASNGNVGINKSNPTERLDVSGNINITGTIKANGVDGQPNQVLMKNNSGGFTWGDIGDFKEYVSFVFTSIGAIQTWTVPPGITIIKADVWGGGGSCYAGGGGTGFITGYFTVTPGTSVSLVVGEYGPGSAYGSVTNNDGDDSRFTSAGITITANGGLGSYSAGGINIYLGHGGGYRVSSVVFKNWTGVEGDDGMANEIKYIQPNSTTYWESTIEGKGGSAGNTTQTGGAGGYYLYNVTGAVPVRYLTPSNGKVPGGGGSGNANYSPFLGMNGANGLVIIHY